VKRIWRVNGVKREDFKKRHKKRRKGLKRDKCLPNDPTFLRELKIRV
jgi:hypothetical protein